MKTIRNILGLHFSTVFLFGFLYPVTIWAIGLIFPNQSEGLPIKRDGKIIGFENEGQKFTSPGYFWGRPSAADYDASASAASNLGPTNPDFLKTVSARLDTLLIYNPGISKSQIPVDMITASASGLDPHISPQGAFFQIPRIASSRHLSQETLRKLVNDLIEKPYLGFLGPERINVLKLNLALDNIQK